MMWCTVRSGDPSPDRPSLGSTSRASTATRRFAVVALIVTGCLLNGVTAGAQPSTNAITGHITPMPDHIDRTHRVRLADAPADRCPEAARPTVRAEQAFIDTYADQVERAMKRRQPVSPAVDAKLGLELQGVVADDAYAVVVRRTSNDIPRNRISDLVLCSGLTGGTSRQARAIGLYAPANGNGAGALLYSPYIGLYALSI